MMRLRTSCTAMDSAIRELEREYNWCLFCHRRLRGIVLTVEHHTSPVSGITSTHYTRACRECVKAHCLTVAT